MIQNNKDKKIQQKYFDERDNRYDESLILKPPYHTKLEIDSIIKKIDGKNSDDYIVDFGSGNGRLTISLLKKGFKVWAVDVSKKSLEELKKNVNKFRFYGLKTSLTLPTAKKSRFIVGTDILHHVDLDSSLSDIYKSLKKGGKVVFSEPGAWNLAWYIYLPLVSNWRVEKGIVNCSYFNLKDKLEKYGFRQIKITGLGFFPRPFFNFFKPLCRLNDWLGNLPILKFFAYRFIIEGIK